MSFSNGRDGHRKPGHHSKNETRKRKHHNEFHSKEDSQDSKSVITDPGPAPPTPSYVLHSDLAGLLPLEDERLLWEFSASHVGFLLSEETRPDFRLKAYADFASFLKILRSYSTSDLLTTLKPSVFRKLNGLRISGFKGQWFDDLVWRLSYFDYHYGKPGSADQEIQNLTKLEVVNCQQNSALEKEIEMLEKEIEILSGKLGEAKGKFFGGKEDLEAISARKEQIKEDKASLEVPIKF